MWNLTLPLYLARLRFNRSKHDYYSFAMEDGGRLAPMTAKLVDRMAFMMAGVRRFPGMSAADSRSLRSCSYVRIKHFVRRSTYVPFRRVWGDACTARILATSLCYSSSYFCVLSLQCFAVGQCRCRGMSPCSWGEVLWGEVLLLFPFLIGDFHFFSYVRKFFRFDFCRVFITDSPNGNDGLPADVGVLHYHGIRGSKLTLDAVVSGLFRVSSPPSLARISSPPSKSL
jgi:hypothetical protein